MPKTLIAALALVACCSSTSAFAQSSDNPGGLSGTPTLILPSTLTNPMTSAPDSAKNGARSRRRRFAPRLSRLGACRIGRGAASGLFGGATAFPAFPTARSEAASETAKVLACRLDP